MKKRILSLVMAGMLAIGLLGGCGNSEDTGTSSGANTEDGERTTLVVGFDAEYPPYGYMDENGEYTGFDLELAAAVCDMEGWELVKKPINWDSKDMELDSEAIDCIWSGFTINGREDAYTWSDAYVDNSQVIVVAANSGITSFADLEGKVVGVQTASAALSVLEDPEQQAALAATFASIEQFADYNSAFTELQAGAIDALAIDIGVANYQIANRGDGYVVLTETLNAEQYGVGFKLGNTELHDIINKDLETLRENGTIAKLAEKYGISDLVITE